MDESLPWDPLLVSAAGLILVSVGRLHAFLPGVDSLRPGLLLTAVALVTLAGGQRGARKLAHLRQTRLGRIIALFVLWSILTAPFALYAGRAVSFLLESFLREMVVVIAVSASIRNLNDLKRLVGVFGFGVIAFSVLATGTGGRQIGGGGYDANDSAMFIVSGVPVVLYFLVNARTSLLRVVFGFGLVATISAVVVSSSRGGFLGLVAVLAYSLFFLKGIKKSVRLVLVTVAGILMVSNASGEYWERMRTIGAEDDYNVTSYTGRKQIWKRGMGYMWDHPLTGVGIANFSVAEGRHPETVAMLATGKGVKFSVAHSIWVQVGAELGVPGLIGLILILWTSFRVLWSVERRHGPHSRGVQASELEKLSDLCRPLIGMLLGAAVCGSFLSRAYSGLFWLPFSLSLAVEKLSILKRRELNRVARVRHPIRTQRTASGL